MRAPHAIAPNVLNRDFTATAPNQKWVADFTYVWTQEGWLYVAVVLDLYSRRAVGWSMQETMTAQLVTDALMMAGLAPPLHLAQRGSRPHPVEAAPGPRQAEQAMESVFSQLAPHEEGYPPVAADA